MAAIRGLPVKFTQVSDAAYANVHPNVRPQKMVVIGDLPVPATAVKTLPATPGSFADLAAARTAVEALRAALATSPYFD